MPENFAKLIGAGFRDKDKLTSQVARHLLKVEESEYQKRGKLGIHPSEAANENWCHRASYYRLAGFPAEPLPRQLTTELIFERGHDSHRKWQTWFWEMGLLRGMWRCTYCRLRWEDVSPDECPRCHLGADMIKYAEVPAQSDDYLIEGQADGDIALGTDDDPLIEIKTIGAGTVRIDAPQLVKSYTYSHVDEHGKKHSYEDWGALWRGIRRPFPSHLRQGMLYLLCRGRTKMVFIYDPKFITAYPKEFEITYRQDLIQDVLDKCLVVRSSLEKGRPPKRPIWATVASPVCKKCPFRSECWKTKLLTSPSVE